MMRDAIFISHATPEDNDFARWLGSKLELAGYKVWHDLARLKGGDYFWDKIEAAIRNDSFRFVAVVSKVAVGKQGVKDEWAVAGTIERSVPGFVIPVRIDDILFGDVPISLHRKNLLDFTGGWHKGLAALVDTLEEAQAPKVTSLDPALARHWLPALKEGAVVKTDVKETLDSTWLPILLLPPAIETARILGKDREIKVTEANRKLPWFEHEDRIVGFATGADLVSLMAKSVMLQASNAADTSTFINEGSTLGDKKVTWWEARKRVGNLVRQAWELAMEVKGFASVYQSGGRRIFYVTPELTGGRSKYVHYEDFDGKKRIKALNGRSEKHGACWAYGVAMVISFDDPWRVELRHAVIFTDDDGKPLEDALRSHRLRRGFCKSWWNEQWRTLMRAFLWLASEGQAELLLPVGSGRSITLGSTPIQFDAPCGLSDVEQTVDADPVDEVDEEDLALEENDEEGGAQ
ncbi:toll/interleukin-1 receptor domain-containing protein [bacterium]|nr:MAG: toll/interleukin-1 receptor domain-containing protein [bacterium]